MKSIITSDYYGVTDFAVFDIDQDGDMDLVLVSPDKGVTAYDAHGNVLVVDGAIKGATTIFHQGEGNEFYLGGADWVKQYSSTSIQEAEKTNYFLESLSEQYSVGEISQVATKGEVVVENLFLNLDDLKDFLPESSGDLTADYNEAIKMYLDANYSDVYLHGNSMLMIPTSPFSSDGFPGGGNGFAYVSFEHYSPENAGEKNMVTVESFSGDISISLAEFLTRDAGQALKQLIEQILDLIAHTDQSRYTAAH